MAVIVVPEADAMLEFITLTFETPLPNIVAALKLSPTAILWKRCSKPVALSREMFALLFDSTLATFSLFTVSVISVSSFDVVSDVTSDVAFDESETVVSDLLLFTVETVVLEFPFFILEEL